MSIKEAIEMEADACAESAQDLRNKVRHREIFWLVSIVLKGIVERSENYGLRSGSVASHDEAVKHITDHP